MSRLRRSLVWLLAVLWLPAILHCEIDQAGLFASPPGCCEHDEQHQAADDDAACDETCAVFDLGLGKVRDAALSLPAPPLLDLADWLRPAAKPDAAAAPSLLSRATDSPPELSRTWQFSARTALPARAPSHLA